MHPDAAGLPSDHPESRRSTRRSSTGGTGEARHEATWHTGQCRVDLLRQGTNVMHFFTERECGDDANEYTFLSDTPAHKSWTRTSAGTHPRFHTQHSYLKPWTKAPIFIKTSCMNMYCQVLQDKINCTLCLSIYIQYEYTKHWNIWSSQLLQHITTSRISRVICLQDFFEAVLGQQSCYWTAISRSHLVLTEVDPGSFLVQRLDQEKMCRIPHFLCFVCCFS